MRGAEESSAPGAVLVSAVMTARVYSVTPGWSLLSAARLLRDHHVSGVPVVDRHDRVIGILSETDLANDLHRATGLGSVRGVLDLVLAAGGFRGRELIEQAIHRLKHTKVSEAMHSPAVCVSPTTSVSEAARVLKEHGVNRLPVLDDGKLIGIVTREDLLGALGRGAPRDASPARRRYARGPG